MDRPLPLSVDEAARPGGLVLGDGDASETGAAAEAERRADRRAINGGYFLCD